MSADAQLNVVVCWHMHQPQYRDLVTGQYHLPWTYLHAIKDYADMAAHLENCPGAKAVVNFAPVLIEQINDYAQQLNDFFVSGSALRDPLLSVLSMASLSLDDDGRKWLIHAALRANRQHLVDRFPAYRRLADVATQIDADDSLLTYFNDQYLFDLVTWYHLAWMGETVRRRDAQIQALMEKGVNFTLADRHALLEVMTTVIGGVLNRYRTLAEMDRVELSMSPDTHPILPLLLDLDTAKEAMPDAPMPKVTAYPGGLERAHDHVRRGIEKFQASFGFVPSGCWPSEGAVSEDTLRLLDEYPFHWVASGDAVFRNSLQASKVADGDHFHRVCKFTDAEVRCFFRDDGLSDMIGFTYSDWDSTDAVNNLLHHLENIANEHPDDPDRVVSIIMDGENAWEYYPGNAIDFLSRFYDGLVNHPRINLTTYSEFLRADREVLELDRLVAGSWVYGTLSTWIGDAGKNRGWEMLADAKRVYDKALAAGELDDDTLALADAQLAVCEGSDWFWWFGDYNPEDTVSDFDTLFRRHLHNLYQILGKSAPAYLDHAFNTGSCKQAGDAEAAGVMRRGSGSA